MIFTIAARELRSLFLSPLAWAVMAVVQFIHAWLFLSLVDYFMRIQPQLAGVPGAPGVTDQVAAPLFNTAGVVMLLVVPLLSMRLVAEERRAKTLALLMSAPASMSEIVLGKYLGLLTFLLLMVLLTALMPLSLGVGTSLDLGTLAAGVLGLALLVAAFAAAGLFLSTLTAQPVVAAISTFGLLLLLWIIDNTGHGSDRLNSLLAYLSLLRHQQPLLKGIFDSADVTYYLLFIATFLGLSIRRLDAERLPHG